MRIGSVVVIVWLIIGVIAGGQRHYFGGSNPKFNGILSVRPARRRGRCSRKLQQPLVALARLSRVARESAWSVPSTRNAGECRLRHNLTLSTIRLGAWQSGDGAQAPTVTGPHHRRRRHRSRSARSASSVSVPPQVEKKPKLIRSHER